MLGVSLRATWDTTLVPLIKTTYDVIACMRASWLVNTRSKLITKYFVMIKVQKVLFSYDNSGDFSYNVMSGHDFRDIYVPNRMCGQR